MRRPVLRLLVLVLALAPSAVKADGFVPPRCGDECLRGDPVDTAVRSYFHRLRVAKVSASPQDLDLVVTFSSTAGTWYFFDDFLVSGLLKGVPGPFGGPSSGNIHWTHNWFAFVADQESLLPDAGSKYPTYAMVRDTRTTQQEFGARSHSLLYPPGTSGPDCVPTTLPGAPPGAAFCWAGPSEFAPATPGRLLKATVPTQQKPQVAYALYQEDGSVESYGHRLDVPAVGSTPPRTLYFLSGISDAAGRLVARVSYGPPKDAAGLLLPGSPNGAYVSSVESGPGQQLAFIYMRRALGGGLFECVLERVRAIPPKETSGGVDVAKFTYGASLSSVEGNLVSETFAYPGSVSFEIPEFLRRRGGTIITDYRNLWGSLFSDGAGRNVVNPWSGSPTAATWHGLQLSSTTREVGYPVASDGAFGTVAGYVETLSQAAADSNLELRPFVWKEEHSCTAPNACSPGTLATWVVTKQPAPEIAHEAGKKDKRGNWVMTPMHLATPSSGPAAVMPVKELQGEYRGVPSTSIPDVPAPEPGTPDVPAPEPDSYPDALEAETYEWRYSPMGHQQRSKVKRTSVVDGSPIETEYRYDGSRLAAILETGKTKLFSDEVPVARVRATFFKTERRCKEKEKEKEKGPDPYNRTVRVEGPCFLAPDEAATATSCGPGSPLLELVYYSGAEGRPENRGRLMSAWRFPTGVSGGPPNTPGAPAAEDCRAEGVGLPTHYADYTAAGDPGKVTDANGVEQLLTWGSDLGRQRELQSRTISVGGTNRTWSYEWDVHKLVAVTYPEGNKEVFCYRKGTRPGYCPTTASTPYGFPWSEQLQWQAKCNGSGQSCPESIFYSYWPDQTLKERTYFLGMYPNPELRRREAFASDAHRRLTAERAGADPGTAGDTSVTTKRAYDASDNLAALGPAANFAPDFCFGGANEEPSRLCTWLTWDRANRLAQVDFHPDSGGGTSRTCLEYDSRGNVRRQNMGCDETSSCTTDRSGNTGIGQCNPAWVDYEWDDFDNVIRVHFPWTEKADGSRGTVRYQFDALGNVVKKQNEELRGSAPPNHLTYRYDALGRLRELVRSKGNSQGPSFQAKRTELLLYRLTYDASSMGETESGCPTLANARGRLALRVDSFGKTGYVYDEEGRVLKEVRIRAGQAGCGGGIPLNDKNPDTVYSYTGNGDLRFITYPHGRTVSYSWDYASGAARVQSVGTWVFNGVMPVSTTLVNEVKWEPYGGLRSYRLAPSGARVEYYLAGGLQADPAGADLSCALLEASSAQPTDGSGRLRGLFVSSAGTALGAPTGDLFKQVYRWKGDALEKQWTCYRNVSGPAEAQAFAHDGTQRLLSSTASGNGATEAFAFAGAEGRRGSRTSATSSFTGMDAPCTQEYQSLASTPTGKPFQQDLLGTVRWGASNGGSACNSADVAATGRYDWSWDSDGRRTKLSDATGLYVVATGYAQTRLGAGLDSVIHTATVSGGSYFGGNYTYFYDAFGRRRAKRLPWWEQGDEFFHDLGSQLLSDRGVNSMGSTPTEYPEVDYVWLGGRPVAAILGKFAINTATGAMARQAETGSCPRNGEAAPCGVKYLVTDYIGKPVLVLDREVSPRIAAVGRYTAFGHANRFPFFYGSKHYQSGSDSVASFSAGLPAANGWDSNARVLLHRTQGATGGTGQFPFYDLNGMPHAMGDFAHRWSAFVPSESGDYVLSYVGNALSYGFDTEAVEIRVKESAASWWFPNLRFPGQYYDEETELHANGYRFMDPGSGRFTGPDPDFENPVGPWASMAAGGSVEAYSFAGGSPITLADPTGRYSVSGPCKTVPGEGDAKARIEQRAREIAKGVGKKGEKDDCFATCVRERVEKQVVTCNENTLAECGKVKRQAERDPKAVAWLAYTAVGPLCDLKKPTWLGWCDKEVSEDCIAKALVHESAHLCGWREEDDTTGRFTGVPRSCQ